MQQKQPGFTIVELLVVMAILSSFIFILTNILTVVLDLKLEAEAVSSVEQDNQYLFARLHYDLKRAQSITTPATLGSSSDSIQLVVNGLTVQYALVNGTVQITDSTGTYNANGFNTTVSQFNAKRTGSIGGKPALQISYTITSNTQRVNGPEVKQFQTTIGIQ